MKAQSNRKDKIMCCEAQGATGEVNGECPECGEPTVDGEAVDVCGYSPDDPCPVCGSNPCSDYC